LLAWGLARGTSVIPKAASLDHQEENFGALAIELEKEDI
jgi:diketogulonate reductase-like aldo/keto reductase